MRTGVIGIALMLASLVHVRAQEDSVRELLAPMYEEAANGELVINGILDVVKKHELEVMHIQVYLSYSVDRPGEGLTMLVDYSVAGMISFKGTVSFLTTAGRSLSEHRFQIPECHSSAIRVRPCSLFTFRIDLYFQAIRCT